MHVSLRLACFFHTILDFNISYPQGEYGPVLIVLNHEIIVHIQFEF